MSEANFNHLSEDSKQESVSISLGHDSGKIQEDNKQDSRELVIDTLACRNNVINSSADRNSIVSPKQECDGESCDISSLLLGEETKDETSQQELNTSPVNSYSSINDYSGSLIDSIRCCSCETIMSKPGFALIDENKLIQYWTCSLDCIETAITNIRNGVNVKFSEINKEDDSDSLPEEDGEKPYDVSDTSDGEYESEED
jgi:hypothetical protein